MRFWHRVSPVLIVLMLLVQFQPAVEVSARQLMLHDIADPVFADIGASPLTSGTLSPSALSVQAGVAQPGFDTALGQEAEPTVSAEPLPLKVTPDNSQSFGTATGKVVNDTEWPEKVIIEITNHQAFWLGIDLVSSTGGASIDGGYDLPFIPPDTTVTYIVSFSETTSSDLRFFVDGSFAVNPGGLETGFGGSYITLAFGIIELFALRAGLSNADIRDYALNNFDKVMELADLFLNSMDCGYGLAEASQGNLWAAAQSLGECIFDASIVSAIVNILVHMGVEGAANLVPKVAVFAVLQSLYDFARLVYGMASGAYGGTIIFESPADTRGSVVVNHVDEEGVALLGACFTLFQQAPESAQRGARQIGGCDGDDRERDGTTTLRSPEGTLILGETMSPAGYLASEDQTVLVETNQATSVTMVGTQSAQLIVTVEYEDGTMVPGACFTLHSDNGGVPGAEVLSQCDDQDRDDAGTVRTSDGRTLFETVPAGDYILVQTVSPYEYSTAENLPLSFAEVERKSVTVVNTLLTEGSLVINLSGEDESLPLGACFDVFKTDVSPRQFIARLCDDVDGTLRLDPITRGSYILVQVTTPSGYVSADDVPFAIVGGRETEFSVRNRLPGTLSIRHVDDAGTLLFGGCFELITSQAAMRRCDTNRDGIIDIMNLRPGFYTLRQASIPEGYFPANDEPVEILPLQTTVIDSVSRRGGTLVISTVGSEGISLTGACYSLFTDLGGGQVGNSVASVCDESDGQDDGVASLVALTPRSYILRQDRVPEGYAPAADLEVTIPAEPGVVPVTVQNLPGGRPVVTMVDKETGEENTWGACYEVYADAAGSRGAQVLTNQCGSRGNASVTLGSLSHGSYLLTHSAFASSWPFYWGSNTPYFLAEDVPFTIVGGEDTSLTVAVAPWPSLVISMEDEAGNPLPGACFTVGWGVTGRSACDADDGADDGTITVTKVSLGVQSLRQDRVPEGYAPAADLEVTIPAEPGVVPVTVQNLPGGHPVVTMVDKETGEAISRAACYEVYADADGSRGAQALTNQCGYSSDGSVTLGSLLPGSYILVHSGFASSGSPYYRYDTPYFLAEDVPFTIVGGEDTSLTVAVAPWPSLVISMEDEAGNPLPGACFTVGWGVTGRSACDADDGADDGTITVTKVQPGIQWLEETRVPAGYARLANLHVTIPAEPGVVPVTVQNLPGGSVIATRWDSTGQTLLGSCYDVYTDAGDGDHGQHIGSGCDGEYTWWGSLLNADGTAIFDGLLPGNYVLVETRTPQGGTLVPDTRFAIVGGRDTFLRIGGQPAGTEIVFAFNVSSSVAEGSAIALALGPQGDAPDSLDGYSFAFDCGDGNGYAPFSNEPSVTCPTTDNSDRTVKGKVRDSEGQDIEFVAQVTVSNVAPTLTEPGDQIAELDASTTMELGSFADPGPDSPWTVVVDWGDGSEPAPFEVTVPGSLGTHEHTYVEAGAYSVTVTVIDKDGDRGSSAFTVATRGQSEVAGSMTVSVVDADELPLGGACFELYVEAGNGAVGDRVATACDADDGKDDGTLGFEGLATGDYILVESVAPVGYPRADAQRVTVVGAQTQEIVVQHLPATGGSLGVTVADDAETPQPVPGACFQVVAAADGTPDLGQVIAEACDGTGADATGMITFDGLPSGDYALVVESPEGYLPVEPIPFSISDGEAQTLTLTIPRDRTGLAIAQQANRGVASVGDTIVFTATIRNTGEVPLTGLDAETRISHVETFDPYESLVPTCEASELAPGEETTCTVEYTVTEANEAAGTLYATGYAQATESPRVATSDPLAIPIVLDALRTLTLDAPVELAEGSPIELTVRDAENAVDGLPAAGLSFAFDCGAGDGLGAFDADPTASCATTDDGSRTVTAVARDEHGRTKEFTAEITITNVAPVVTAADDQAVDEGAAQSFAFGTFADPGADSPWAVAVDWGDGGDVARFEVTEAGSVGTLEHTYVDNGAYTVTVSVTDRTGDTGSATFTVTVANVAPTVRDAVVDITPSEEDVAVFAQATFGDPGTADGPFTCTVDYGDGTGPQPGTVDETTCIGPSHAYPDDGEYVVTVAVADKDGGIGAATTTQVVNDVPPTLTTPMDQSTDEGTVQVFDLGAFTDPGADAPWTVTVDWGDGSGPTTFTVAEAGPVGAEHAFADNGTFTVIVSVTDKDGVASYPATFSVTVSNVSPTGPLTNAGPVGEGDAVAIALTDAFDPSMVDTGAGLRYAFACDGSSLEGVTYATSGVDAATTCAYPDGPFTATVRARVIDKDDGFTEYTTDVTVLNVPPTVDAGFGGVINEGETFLGSGWFTDPGLDTWTATIDYGDGTATQSLALNADNRFIFSHLYADDGTYTVIVSVADEDGDSGVSTVIVDVLNVAPTVGTVAGPTHPLGPQGTADISAEFTDPGVHDTHYATVDWGDGTVTDGYVVGNAGWGTVSASHLYGAAGTYVVIVTVYDDSGEPGQAVFEAVQVNGPPSDPGPPDNPGPPDDRGRPEDAGPPA